VYVTSTLRVCSSQKPLTYAQQLEEAPAEALEQADENSSPVVHLEFDVASSLVNVCYTYAALRTLVACTQWKDVTDRFESPVSEQRDIDCPRDVASSLGRKHLRQLLERFERDPKHLKLAGAARTVVLALCQDESVGQSAFDTCEFLHRLFGCMNCRVDISKTSEEWIKYTVRGQSDDTELSFIECVGGDQRLSADDLVGARGCVLQRGAHFIALVWDDAKNAWVVFDSLETSAETVSHVREYEDVAEETLRTSNVKCILF
jgi:hypothetical protein